MEIYIISLYNINYNFNAMEMTPRLKIKDGQQCDVILVCQEWKESQAYLQLAFKIVN